ncbi:MAG: radical SAM protein [Spirochaetota bacterium]|nr:radical SAM protein [Spirochaetota bacterium]
MMGNAMVVINAMPSKIHEAIKKENLSIEVTTRCTSNCTYCFVRSGSSEYHDLDYRTVLSIIKEGYEIGYRHLHITGGEPLLWGHLFDICDNAIVMGYESIFLNTNGFLFDSNTLKKLKSIKGLNLSISLLGFPDIHDTFRGYNSFIKTAQAIEMALNHNIPLYLFCVVGKSLLAHLPHFVQWAFQKFPGIKEITLIQLIRVSGNADKVFNELLTPDDFVSLVRIISLLNVYGFSVSLLENPLAAVVAQMLELPWFSSSPHLIRPGRLTIKADKSITIAHSSCQSLGTYSRGKLHRILTSEVYLHGIEDDCNTCASCKHMAVCRKAGMQRPSEPFRDMQETIPYCKRVLDSLL